MIPPGNGIAPFEFATATRIVFGCGRIREVGALTRELGRRALVVTGSQPDRAAPLLHQLSASGVTSEIFPISGEPTALHVAAGLARAQLKGCDVFIGFGGGSAIDAAKAIAGLVTNEIDLFDALEVVGRGKALTRPAAPWIAVPTTAGAGAEVTRNAVITSRQHKVKASLRSPYLLARVALVDPELTVSLPASVTAATGLDALTQLIEPFVSSRANPITDALCLDGLGRVARSLARAVSHPDDLPARTDMCLTALFGGLALANAGLGAVHGLAAPIGGAFPASHGAICAALLPHAMRLNLRKLVENAPSAPAIARFQTVARLLTGNPAATADDGIDQVLHLTRALGIPGLSALGIPSSAFADLAEKSLQSSSMKANPTPLEHSDLIGLLHAAA